MCIYTEKMILKEEVIGNVIKNYIRSSNMKYSEYNTETKEMTIIFNNDKTYVYLNIPHTEYTKFRLSESQGSYFSKNISQKYKYEKK